LSPFFGNVYACWASFRSSFNSNGFPEPILFSRSTDGGDTWSSPNQLTAAVNVFNNPVRATGRQGCTIRNDSHGVVYVFYTGAFKGQEAQLMVRSFDGGVSFERPRPVATIVGPGGPPDFTFDGVQGAGNPTFPSVDIANGAPTGDGATDEIVLTWPDARNGLNHEEALLQYSLDRGVTWSKPTNVAEAADRPALPALAISPNGRDVYVTYDAFLDPYRQSYSDARRVQGVVRHADAASDGSLVSWRTLHRGAIGDARAIGHPLIFSFERWGDYNYAIATNTYGSAAWNDVRNGAVCAAINAYRQSFVTGEFVARPAPGTDCPPKFANSDAFGATFTDPSP